MLRQFIFSRLELLFFEPKCQSTRQIGTLIHDNSGELVKYILNNMNLLE